MHSNMRFLTGALAITMILSGCNPAVKQAGNDGGVAPQEETEYSHLIGPDASEYAREATPVESVVDDITPQDYTGGIVSLEKIIEMKDDAATRLISGQPRQVILAAWGEPDMERHPEEKSDIFADDEWMVLDTYGVHYVDVFYDNQTGNVSEVTIRGTNGLCSADIKEIDTGVLWTAGIERKYWEDGPSESEFKNWAETVDATAILEKFQSAGLTRESVRDLLHYTYGCWFNSGYIYQGDVFENMAPDGSWRFLCVEYDSQTHTIPIAITEYPGMSEDGEYLPSPAFTDGEIYAPFLYNSLQEEQIDPAVAELEDYNTWRAGLMTAKPLT